MRRPGVSLSVTAPALGVIGIGVALLAGGWLMYAPFAYGCQPAGADWANPATADFWTGLRLRTQWDDVLTHEECRS